MRTGVCWWRYVMRNQPQPRPRAGKRFSGGARCCHGIHVKLQQSTASLSMEALRCAFVRVRALLWFSFLVPVSPDWFFFPLRTLPFLPFVRCHGRVRVSHLDRDRVCVDLISLISFDRKTGPEPEGLSFLFALFCKRRASKVISAFRARCYPVAPVHIASCVGGWRVPRQ
jgi:hypothetical protein